jgi:hypothetical protein
MPLLKIEFARRSAAITSRRTSATPKTSPTQRRVCLCARACVRVRVTTRATAGRRRQVCRTLRRRRRLLGLPHHLKVHTHMHASAGAHTPTHARTQRRTHRYYCGLCSKTRPSAAHFEGRPYNADHAAGASLCAWVCARACAWACVGVGVCARAGLRARACWCV